MIYLGKLSIYIYAVTVLLILINGGCVKREFPSAGNGDDTIVDISVRTNNSVASNGVDLLFGEEETISTIRVITFDRSTESNLEFEKNQYAKSGSDYGDVIKVGNSYTLSMRVNEHPNKEFYLVVNEPLSLKQELDAIKTLSALEAMQYQLAEYFTDLTNTAFCFGGGAAAPTPTFKVLPMFGKALKQNIVANDKGFVDNAVVISVGRTLARVDLKLQKADPNADIRVVNGVTSFKHTTYSKGNITDLQHITESAALGEQEVAFNRGSDVAVTSGDFTHILSFYTPARSCTSEAERVKIILGDIKYKNEYMTFAPIILNSTVEGGSISAIKPNTIYEVKGVITQKNLDIIINPMEWENYAVDGDIVIEGGSSIKAPSSVFVNYPQSSNRTKVISYKGSQDVKIYVGGKEIIYSTSGTSLIPVGGYSQPAWLESATWSKRADKLGEGELILKYREATGDITKNFDLELKSGGAIRSMSVKYVTITTVAPWDDEEINGDINEDLNGVISFINAPHSVLMDYSANSSYTKSVSFKGSHRVKIFVGGIEILFENSGTSLIPPAGYSKPAWLKSAIWNRSGDDKAGTLIFTCQGSSVEGEFEVALRSGTSLRRMVVTREIKR